MKSLVAYLVLFVVGSGSAFACTCSAPLSERSYFDGASHVFTAVVTGVKVVEPGSALVGDVLRRMRIATPQVVEAVFAVTETFKGEPDSLVAIYTATQSTACGVALSVGDEFVIFADEFGAISSCSGNVASDSPAWARVLADVRRFEGEPPEPPFNPLVPIEPHE